MTFSYLEKEKFKKMLLYAVKQKAMQTQGHNGFSLYELQPILDELESEGKIRLRPVVGSNATSKHYFIK